MRIDWSRYHVRLDALGRILWPRGVPVSPLWARDPTVTDQDLWLVWTGTGRVRLRQGWTGLRPGSCLWMRPGWNYEMRQDPQDPLGMSFLHFDLVDGRGRRRPSAAPLPPELLEPPDGQLAELMTRRIVELCIGFQETGFNHPPYQPAATVTATTLLTGLLMELDGATDVREARTTRPVAPQQDRLIRQVAIRISENPQHPLAVAALAREFWDSPNHFTRLFRHVTGQTPELYAVRARIGRAKHLLRETTLPVGEVASVLGYRDIYFFSRQFKQFAGRSPLAYRRQPAAPGAQPHLQ